MSADEKRISELAHQIWETEGKPHGQDARHWEMARKLAESEALAPKKPSKTNKPKELASVTSGKADGAGTAKPAASKAAEKKPAAKSTAKPAASSTKASAKPPATKTSTPTASSPVAPEKKPRAPRKPSAT